MKKLLGCVCALIAINSFAAWSYNSDTSTITDGNWELVCSKGTGEKELIIGVSNDWNNAYKAGSGVLDLTTFEEDTGYKIVKFNNWAFNVAGTSGNANLIGVICPTATIISKNAFAYCNKITMISFPEVIEIGNNAFYGCTVLSGDVEFPKLEILNNQAFRGCKGITGMSMPSLISLKDSALRECSSLTNLVVSPDIHTFGNQGLRECPLVDITPREFPKIINNDNRSHGFMEVAKLKGTLSFPNMTVVEECFFYSSGIESVSIPAATVIKRDAFNGSKLKTLTVSPDKITTINHQAFRGCKDLTAVPDNIFDVVKVVEYGAFQDCTAMTTPPVIKSPYLTAIAKDTFNGTAGKFNGAVDIYSPIASIGDNAFLQSANGQVYNFHSETVPTTIGVDAFSGKAQTDMSKLYVHNYKAVKGWTELCAANDSVFETLKSREDYPGSSAIGVIKCDSASMGSTYHWVISQITTGSVITLH